MLRSVVFRLAVGWMMLAGVAAFSGAPAGAQTQAPRSQNAPMAGTSCTSPPPHGFSDVAPGSSYDVAVAWLVAEGITSGTSPGKFSPSHSVNRGQMAAFLWRAAGSPPPSGPHGFSDVPVGGYFEDAVTWLVAEGITTGTSPGKFSPSQTVNRGQMAAFLWRAAGSLVIPGAHGFSDVPTGSYFEKAVTWLVAQGITTGTSPGKYSPSQSVNRGQMALFLWRSACLPQPAVAAGGFHSCALKQDGTVACWGDNGDGQLGDGTTTSRPWAAPVVGLTEISAITAGDGHTCALRQDGSVACWGDNANGQLGDGTTTNRSMPTAVTGPSGFVSISAGFYHTCTVRQNGAVACWGRNNSGQLGDGTTVNKPTQTAVAGLSDVAEVSVGATHSCGLKQSGAVVCWGSNESGQLGDGTTTKQLAPGSSVVSGATALAAGVAHTCAVKQAGTAQCWGSNYNGQLGDGTKVDRRTPGPVGGLVKAAAVSGGSQHTCALRRDGIMVCWGGNGGGQLGNGSTTSRLSPFPASISGVRGISVGRYHTCAVTYGRTVACWGDNRRGALGNGTTTDDPTPTPAPVIGL